MFCSWYCLTDNFISFFLVRGDKGWGFHWFYSVNNTCKKLLLILIVYCGMIITVYMYVMILHKMTSFPIRDIFETIAVNEIKTTGTTSNTKVVFSCRESRVYISRGHSSIYSGM